MRLSLLWACIYSVIRCTKAPSDFEVALEAELGKASAKGDVTAALATIWPDRGAEEIARFIQDPKVKLEDSEGSRLAVGKVLEGMNASGACSGLSSDVCLVNMDFLLRHSTREAADEFRKSCQELVNDTNGTVEKAMKLEEGHVAGLIVCSLYFSDLHIPLNLNTATLPDNWPLRFALRQNPVYCLLELEQGGAGCECIPTGVKLQDRLAELGIDHPKLGEAVKKLTDALTERDMLGLSTPGIAVPGGAPKELQEKAQQAVSKICGEIEKRKDRYEKAAEVCQFIGS